MNSRTAGKRVLVIKLGAFGDIVLADGALCDLREHHADAELHVLTRRAFAPLLARCPWVDAVHIDDNAARWRLPAMLRWRRAFLSADYACVYDLQNSRRTQFYRKWLSGRGARHPQWSHAERDVAQHSATRVMQRSVPEQLAHQLEAAGIIATHSRRPQPLWVADDIDMLLHNAGVVSPFVVLLPGSSARHPEKRWPHFAALSHVLVTQGTTVVTIPGPEENNLGPEFAGHLLHDGARCLDLHQLAGVTRAAQCVIGNDSGPLHLAACLDAPCVALFDRNNPTLDRTGIEHRNALRLIGTPLSAVTVSDVVEAMSTLIEH